ncbi:hypothetical protein AURDEDRAFT_61212 [Auricularia subglabra TFB-10046 SS5]|nr:hypothetical protein AURDEDRAFT_61212 [Auricularia subglabra TFB-10046 SS5]
MGITREITKDYVTFVHGDLGGSERVQSAQLYRSIEPDELDRLKGVVDVPGLFHVMMASEDAVFRLHCLASDSQKDESSLFHYIKVILPNRADHGKFASSSPGPSYRMAHDAFTHVLWALLFDAWTHEAAVWQADCTTLERFAEALAKLPHEQAWSIIRRRSFIIAEKYVAGPDFYQQRHKPTSERDQIFENWQLFISHMLVHHDLVYSIKIQDVGRVCLALWSLMFIFPAAGKHKYASHSLRVLTNLAYVYPKPLREAFMHSWIINPSGKPEGGRGVDWLVELYNLYIKVIHSGASSNFGIDQIIKVSPLVKLYKTVFNNFMFNYHLLGRTVRHAPPNMAETLERLGRRVRRDAAMAFTPGRTSKFQAKDATAWVPATPFRTYPSAAYSVWSTLSDTSFSLPQIDELVIEWPIFFIFVSQKGVQSRFANM